MQTASGRSLFSLYLAYFADYFNWGAAIAFLAIYISTDQSPFHNLFWDKHVALAVAVACFPIGEMAGSPILGDLSDLIGRRSVLLWGLVGSLISLAICAISLWNGSFFLFLVGQLLAGFFSGKQAMVEVAISETDTGTKGQKIAFISVVGGVAWILGPYFGDLLLKEQFVRSGGYVWPSVLACGVFALSLLCSFFLFEDTYQPTGGRFSPLNFLRGMGQLFYSAAKELLFFLFMINLVGWYLLIVSLSYYLIQKFNLSTSQVSAFNSYTALCFTTGGILATTWVLHRFRARRIIFWTQLVGACALFSLFGSEKLAELWIYLAIPALTEGVVYPIYQTLLSGYASEQNRGKVFGLISTSNGACQFLAAAILGALPADLVGGTVLLAASLFFLSAILIPLAIRNKSSILKQV